MIYVFIYDNLFIIGHIYTSACVWVCVWPPGYYHNGFVETHVCSTLTSSFMLILLRSLFVHWYQRCATVHYVPKEISCQKVVVDCGDNKEGTVFLLFDDRNKTYTYWFHVSCSWHYFIQEVNGDNVLSGWTGLHIRIFADLDYIAF